MENYGRRGHDGQAQTEREDRDIRLAVKRCLDVEFAYVVMDANHSQTDHVGRTRLAKLCGSRDDSLSWNLSRVRQDVQSEQTTWITRLAL